VGLALFLRTCCPSAEALGYYQGKHGAVAISFATLCEDFFKAESTEGNEGSEEKSQQSSRSTLGVGRLLAIAFGVGRLLRPKFGTRSPTDEWSRRVPRDIDQSPEGEHRAVRVNPPWRVTYQVRYRGGIYLKTASSILLVSSSRHLV